MCHSEKLDNKRNSIFFKISILPSEIMSVFKKYNQNIF